MNRKGDVPTIILFVVALALVGICLVMFYSFDGGLDGISKQLSEMSYEAEFDYQYIYNVAETALKESINECKGCSADDIKKKIIEKVDKRDLKVTNFGNFFAKIRDKDFVVSQQDKNYILSIQGLFVKSQRGDNMIKRNFDLSVSSQGL